jgi:putative hydrolase of the HAD superfamily
VLIVFDLDDTLYNEIEFVKSGFLEVAKYIDRENYIDSYHEMLTTFENEGSGKIFNRILEKFDNSEINIQKLVNIYRFHKPNISLPLESREVLQSLKGRDIALISDGEFLMQENKFTALGLRDYITYPVFTDYHRTRKPEEKPFKMVMERFAEESEFCYISDNPKKDFIAPQKLGWKTIRYRNPVGIYREIENSADIEITDFLDVLKLV